MSASIFRRVRPFAWDNYWEAFYSGYAEKRNNKPFREDAFKAADLQVLYQAGRLAFIEEGKEWRRLSPPPFPVYVKYYDIEARPPLLEWNIL